MDIKTPADVDDLAADYRMASLVAAQFAACCERVADQAGKLATIAELSDIPAADVNTYNAMVQITDAYFGMVVDAYRKVTAPSSPDAEEE
jgi:hypothetical protein